ncbi:MAG: InlB B-repeat-containing protein, partial [Sedimentisphaerales bacterium]|nr:InlB B-repeat-containing protein [Sedimentisphaerales bacterium]
MKRKILSLVMILCMLISLFPTTALAAEAPEGYITDNNGIMAYRYRSGSYITINCIDFQGYYDGSWLQTTGHKMGFNTYLEIDGGENYRSPGRSVYVPSNTSYVNASGNPETPGIPYMKSSSGLTVDVDANFLYDGKIIQLQYTVENTSANSVNFALGSNSRSCIQLGNTFEKLKVAPFDGGLKISSESSDAQLNFWNGSDIEGVTPVDTCWYGYFDSSQKNTFTDLSSKTTLDIWPGLSWSWKNRTIGAGETQTYSVMFSMGGLGSEILTKEYSVDYSSTLGIEPENVKVEEGISVTLPALTAAGYVFGGWYSDSVLTSFVGTGGESYTPTDNMTLYAKWTAIQSPVNITVTKDGTAWTGQSHALYQSGYYKCALTENGNSGIYSASVANGIYDIYKDGMDTGENVVVATTVTSGTGGAVLMTIGYTTLTTNTQLDGIASTIPGEVDYRSGGAVVFSTTSSDGTYTVIVRDTNTSNYDVYVNALDSNQDISLIDKSITVNYFTGEVAVTLDGAAYNGKNVIFSRTAGTSTYYYTATDDDSDGVYTVMLPAGPSNDYSYTVSVNGRTLSDTVSYGDKSSTAAYYTAHVDVQKDGSDWVSDIDVYLENNGIQQKLTYTGGADYQLILFSDSGTYNVLVSGSNSPQDTGFDVSSNVVQEIDYWSVNFYTTDDTTAYTSRIIQEGKTVSKPSTPNITGKSFAGWYTTTTSDVLYDYANAIEGATD